MKNSSLELKNKISCYDEEFFSHCGIDFLSEGKISDSIKPFTINIRESIVQQIFIIDEDMLDSKEKYPYPTLVLKPIKINLNNPKETFFLISYAHEVSIIDTSKLTEKTDDGFTIFHEEKLHPYWWQFFASMDFYRGKRLVNLDYLLNLPNPTDFVVNQRFAISKKTDQIYHIQYLIFTLRNSLDEDILPFYNSINLKHQQTNLKKLIEQNTSIDIIPDIASSIAILLDETPVDTTEIVDKNHSQLFCNGKSLALKTTNFAHFTFILLMQNGNNPIPIEKLAEKYEAAKDDQIEIEKSQKKYDDSRTSFNKELRQKLNINFDALIKIQKKEKETTVQLAKINPLLYYKITIKTFNTNFNNLS